MNLSRCFRLFGVFCILLAVILFYQRNNPQRVRFNASPTPVKARKPAQSIPAKITIPKTNIDLAIYPSKIINQQWEISTKGASWLDSSPIPGEIGNSIVYGHNWTNLMGNLIFVKPGDEIEIAYKNGTKKTFVVDKTAIVTPNTVSVLNQTTDKRITIYTCTGLFDEKRFIVVALLKSELKAQL